MCCAFGEHQRERRFVFEDVPHWLPIQAGRLDRTCVQPPRSAKPPVRAAPPSCSRNPGGRSWPSDRTRCARRRLRAESAESGHARARSGANASRTLHFLLRRHGVSPNSRQWCVIRVRVAVSTPSQHLPQRIPQVHPELSQPFGVLQVLYETDVLQVERNVAIVLHYSQYIAVEGVRETCLVQHVGIPSREIAHNQSTLNYRGKTSSTIFAGA